MTEGDRPLLLFGGTFDPPHLGHVAVIRGLRQATGWPLLVVPAGVPNGRRAPLLSAETRLELVRVTVAELADPGIEVSAVEVERPGPSYTVDTVLDLSRGGSGDIWLALGADVAAKLKSWRRPAQLMELVSLLVFDRPGARMDSGRALSALAAEGLQPRASRVLEITTPPVSATEVRRRLRAGQSCARLLPAEVEAQLGKWPAAFSRSSGPG